MKKNALKLICTILLILILMSVSVGVLAAEIPTIAISFDGKEYKKGELATAEIIIYDVTYNTLGFALSYDPSSVKVVTPDGQESDDSYDLLNIENLYRASTHEGYHTVLANSVSTDTSTISTVMYITPGVDNNAVSNGTVTADSEGLKIAAITFEMQKDGIPQVDFTTIAGSADFSTAPFIMLNNGKQAAGSTAKIVYNPSQSSSEGNTQTEPDTTNNGEEDSEKNPAGENEIISVILPDTDPTVTGSEDIDVDDVDNKEQPEPGNGKSYTPIIVIGSIAIVGIAIGKAAGKSYMKKKEANK